MPNEQVVVVSVKHSSLGLLVHNFHLSSHRIWVWSQPQLLHSEIQSQKSKSKSWCSETQDGLCTPELSIVFWSPKCWDCRHEPSRLKTVVIGAWRDSSVVKSMYFQRTLQKFPAFTGHGGALEFPASQTTLRNLVCVCVCFSLCMSRKISRSP